MNKKSTGHLCVFLLSLLLAMSSCKKDHATRVPAGSVADTTGTAPPVNNNGPLITRYEYAPNLYTLFTYNGYGQITTITDINDIATIVYAVTYKTDGKVDKISNKYGFWKFTYTNNQLVQADSYSNDNSTRLGYYKFVYDGSQVTELLLYSNYGTEVIKPRSKIDFQYDANGDIIRSDTYLWDLISGTYNPSGYQVYESDKHTNPVYWFRDVFAVLYRMVGPHNYTKASFFSSGGSVEQANVYDYTYTINGYPASAVRRNLAAGTNGFVTLQFVY